MGKMKMSTVLVVLNKFILVFWMVNTSVLTLAEATLVEKTQTRFSVYHQDTIGFTLTVHGNIIVNLILPITFCTIGGHLSLDSCMSNKWDDQLPSSLAQVKFGSYTCG